MAINTRYKDSLFSFLFSRPEALRELYGAIEGVSLDPGAVITINTLSDVLYMEQYNDISFTVDNKLVVLIEHQSTINPNMPLRLLLYIARVYEKITDRKNLYRERLLTIPRPEFIVLYNGPKPYPDRKTLRLSEAFEPGEGTAELDLEVKVYNINRGHNEEIVERSENLKGYSIFVEKVRENRRSMPPEKAMKEAVEYCIGNRILSEVLKENASEVINMLLSEWNIDEAKEVWREEALEEGREQGLEQGLEQGREDGYGEIVKNALAKGYSVKAISELTGLDIATITRLARNSPPL